MILDKHQILGAMHSRLGQLQGKHSSCVICLGKGHKFFREQRQLSPGRRLPSYAHLVHCSFQRLELCRESSSCFGHCSTYYVTRYSACKPRVYLHYGQV